MAEPLPAEDISIIRQYKRRLQAQGSASAPQPRPPSQQPQGNVTPVHTTNRGLQYTGGEEHTQPAVQLGQVSYTKNGVTYGCVNCKGPRIYPQLLALQKKLQAEGWGFEFRNGQWYAVKSINGARVEVPLLHFMRNCRPGHTRSFWGAGKPIVKTTNSVNVPSNLQGVVERARQLHRGGESWEVAAFNASREWWEQRFGAVKTHAQYRSLYNFSRVIMGLAEGDAAYNAAGLQLSQALAQFEARKAGEEAAWDSYVAAHRTAQINNILHHERDYYLAPREVNIEGRTPLDEFTRHFLSGATWGLSELFLPSSGGVLDLVGAQIPGGYSYYTHAPLTPMRRDDAEVYMARMDKLLSDQPGLIPRIYGAAAGRASGELVGLILTPELVGWGLGKLGVDEYLARLARRVSRRLENINIKIDTGVETGGGEVKLPGADLEQFNKYHGFKTETWQAKLKLRTSEASKPSEMFEKAGLDEYAQFFRQLEEAPPKPGSKLWFIYDAVRNDVEAGKSVNDILFEELEGRPLKNWLDDIVKPKETFDAPKPPERPKVRFPGEDWDARPSPSGGENVSSGGAVTLLKPPETTGVNSAVRAASKGGGIVTMLRGVGAVLQLRPATNRANIHNIMNIGGLDTPRANPLQVSIPKLTAGQKTLPTTRAITQQVEKALRGLTRLVPALPGVTKTTTFTPVPHSRGGRQKPALPSPPGRPSAPGPGDYYPRASYKYVNKWRVSWFGGPPPPRGGRGRSKKRRRGGRR